MRIVYLVLGKDVAGGEIVCLQLMRAARERGHTVCLLVPGDGSVKEIATKEGFEVIIFALERTFQFQKAIALAWFLRRWQADLVHTHTMLSGTVLARLGAILAGVPILCHAHLDHNFNRHRPIKWLQQITDNFTAHFCQIVAVSEDTRRALISSGNPPQRIVVIPNGIEIKATFLKADVSAFRSKFGIPPGTKIIGCVARLDPVKGQQDLLAAVQQISETQNKLSFVLMGSDIAMGGRYEAELRSQAEKLGITQQIYFTGFQPNAADLISVFDVFVLPSYREGMPMSILEAMAAAKPVIATAVNGVPEVVLDDVTGLLVPPGAPKVLGRAILKLSRDDDARQKMGLAGRRRVKEHFNLVELHKRIFALYDRMTAKHCG